MGHGRRGLPPAIGRGIVSTKQPERPAEPTLLSTENDEPLSVLAYPADSGEIGALQT